MLVYLVIIMSAFVTALLLVRVSDFFSELSGMNKKGKELPSSSDQPKTQKRFAGNPAQAAISVRLLSSSENVKKPWGW